MPEFFPCPVKGCDHLAEMVRAWGERPPGATEFTTRVLVRCLAYHWVAVNEEELKRDG